MSFRLLLQAGVMLCVFLSVVSCGTKKNTALSRNWQAFNTRYNVYFNGSEHYKETLHDMEKSYEDDYTRLLPVHPAESRANPRLPRPSGDFGRTREKMQKAIQLHSITRKPVKRSSSAKEKAFRARTEFNPFLHNAWMLLGKSQFMDGDFSEAATTFLYISRHFTWLPSTVTEARLWQARCYCALDWLHEAENVLRLVKEKDLTDGSLRHLYYLVAADYEIREGNYGAAADNLEKAVDDATGVQKHRLWFLLGQIRSLNGQRKEAYEAFKKAGSGVSTSYLTKFNARVKQSEVFPGGDISGEVRKLKRMTKYERNSEYLDRIYYAIGNLYLSKKDTAEAKKNYALALQKSERGGIDKALAGIALGNIYFGEGEYVKAQPCYSEAVPQLPDDYPGKKGLVLRSDVLDELALFAGNVELQDSLLRLASMTQEEREAVCRKIVDNLIKSEKEAADAARLEEMQARGEGPEPPFRGTSAPVPPLSLNTDKSWYFYNETARAAGKQEFQRRWGSRKLEDNWRRRDKTEFQLDGGTDEETDVADDSVTDKSRPGNAGADVSDKGNDPHEIEYYLRQIPSTQAEIQNARDIVQDGLYNMGLILKDRLEDYPAARKVFDELESRFPDNVYRLDVYYNMYLMAVRDNDRALADTWRLKILADFPDSPYAREMASPDYFNNLRRMHQVEEEIYASAYDAYLADDNAEVHRLAGEMEKDYPLSGILPKFVFIDALSYLTEKDYDKFKSRLTELLERWPDTDMTETASGMLRGLKEGKTLQGGGANSRGIVRETRLVADDGAPDNPADSVPPMFEGDPSGPHCLVLVFPLDSVNPNTVLYDVARFNFSSFAVKDFDLEQMRFSDIGLLVVKGFSNLKELEHYRTLMQRSGFSLPREVTPVMISKHDFELLLREGRSFEEYFRFLENLTTDDEEEPGSNDISTASRILNDE